MNGESKMTDYDRMIVAERRVIALEQCLLSLLASITDEKTNALDVVRAIMKADKVLKNGTT